MLNLTKNILSSHFEELRQAARHFAMNYVRPAAAQADKTGVIPKHVLDHPWADILCSAYVPKEYGGGILLPQKNERVECLSSLSILLTEELSAGDPGITCGLPGPSLAFPVLLEFGNDWQKEEYLSRFCRNKNVWGAFAITESGSGTDAAAMKTTAKKVDGGYLLNGTKCFVTNGIRADFVIVFATVNPDLKQFGQRAFIVDKNFSDYTTGAIEKMMGLRASGICEIIFENCFVPESHLLKSRDGKASVAGFKGATSAWDFFRIEVSAISVGIARAILTELEERYGVVDFDLKRDVKMGRFLCQRAALAHDHGFKSDYAVSNAKVFAAKLAMDACVKGIRIVGNESLVEGHLFERLFRAAKVFNILEGTGEIHREHIAASLNLSS